MATESFDELAAAMNEDRQNQLAAAHQVIERIHGLLTVGQDEAAREAAKEWLLSDVNDESGQ